ncbi:MAG TPA: HutD family protein [Actinomycetales bacterium]|nr:HutD family protein [Actinomycetales bacterium]
MTAPVRVLRYADYPVQRWANGGGTTRLVADGAGWRLSLADVAGDGPFSTFPGTARVLTVVAGAGLRLTVDGVDRLVRPLMPFAFDGAATTSGRLLDGPVMAFNLMTDRAQEALTFEVTVREEDALAARSPLVAAMALAPGRLTGTGPGSPEQQVDLARFDTVVVPSAEQQAVPATARLRGRFVAVSAALAV